MAKSEIFSYHNISGMEKSGENLFNESLRLHLFDRKERAFDQIIHLSFQANRPLFIEHQPLLIKVTHLFEFRHFEKTNNTF